MFANRYTAFIDACALAGALKRNLLLTLAEAEFFRLRRSEPVLSEVERAIKRILEKTGGSRRRCTSRARKAQYETAFEDAMVSDFDKFLGACRGLPDPDDAHVVAAALKTQAATIVTDNLKDFPEALLALLNLEVRSTDAFIADTIALDPGRAVPAIRFMRKRFKRPEKTAELLLLDMEKNGLTDVVDIKTACRVFVGPSTISP